MRWNIVKWLNVNGFEEAGPMIMELPLPKFDKIKQELTNYDK